VRVLDNATDTCGCRYGKVNDARQVEMLLRRLLMIVLMSDAGVFNRNNQCSACSFEFFFFATLKQTILFHFGSF
jgi:hypothetical protein